MRINELISIFENSGDPIHSKIFRCTTARQHHGAIAIATGDERILICFWEAWHLPLVTQKNVLRRLQRKAPRWRQNDQMEGPNQSLANTLFR